MLLDATNLSKSIGAQYLFKDISLNMNKNMFSNFTKDELDSLEYLLSKMYTNSTLLK